MCACQIANPMASVREVGRNSFSINWISSLSPLMKQCRRNSFVNSTMLGKITQFPIFHIYERSINK